MISPTTHGPSAAGQSAMRRPSATRGPGRGGRLLNQLSSVCQLCVGTYRFARDYGCVHPGMPLGRKHLRRNRGAPTALHPSKPKPGLPGTPEERGAPAPLVAGQRTTSTLEAKSLEVNYLLDAGMAAGGPSGQHPRGAVSAPAVCPASSLESLHFPHRARPSDINIRAASSNC